ncbi:MAG TPA: SBBP repeat-containing protein, partial [Blastocatellia bacterium]
MRLIRKWALLGSFLLTFNATVFHFNPTGSLAKSAFAGVVVRSDDRPSAGHSLNRANAVPTEKSDRYAANITAARSFGNLPISFEPNQGQYDASVRFAAQASGSSLAMTENGLAISSANAQSCAGPTDQVQTRQSDSPCRPTAIRPMWSKFSPAFSRRAVIQPHTLRMRFIGNNESAPTSGKDMLPGSFNYIVGKDPARWRTGVPSYGRVQTAEIYRGIDVSYYGTHNRLEYDFEIHPKADPNLIRISYPGCPHVSVDRNGDLVLRTSWGEVHQAKPVSYQLVGGRRVRAASSYVVRNGFAQFKLGRYDRSRDLIIDPVLDYSTLLGGSNSTAGNSIAVDSGGNAYVTGSNFSSDFPVVNQGQTYPGNDIFVSKLNADGTALVYSTVIGGFEGDTSTGIAVDGSGSAYVTGYTFSSDFPVTANPLQGTLHGETNAFVTKFSPDGSSLVYSTFLGGSQLDFSSGIAVDQSLDAIVAGQTFSRDFPTMAAAQSNKAGASNGFVSKLNPTGSALIYSTYIGGSTNDACSSVAVDSSGNAYTTGGAQSADFPLLDSIQAGFAATTLVKTSDAAESWQASTTGLPPNAQITCLAVDPKDPSIVFAGTANNGVFRTQDAGAAWSQIGASVIGSASSIAIDPVTPTNVYLSPENSPSVFSSTDGGNTWTLDGSVDEGLINTLAVNPANPSVVFALSDLGFFEGGNDTPDFGMVYLSGLQGDAFFRSMAVSSAAPGTILLAGQNAILISVDGGVEWGQTTLTDALTVAIASKSVAYAGTENGLLKSTDGGSTWKQVFLSEQAVTALAVAPGSTKIVYAAFSDGGLFKSTNSGVTWSPVNKGLSAPFIQALAVDPSNASVLYAGSSAISHPFVVKLAPTGGLLFSTLVGGEGYDAGLGIVADGAGNVLITGMTFSQSFPTLNAAQSANAGLFDAFVTKLSGSVPSILYSTYFGGSMNESGASITVGPTGTAYIAGGTFSANLDVVSPLQPANGGGEDAFALSLGSSGSIVYSTYLGGQFDDLASSVAVDGSGNAYLTGLTVSSNFPTTPGVLKSMQGQQFEQDAFITKIAAPADTLAITSALVSGNALTVFGEQFNQGAT